MTYVNTLNWLKLAFAISSRISDKSAAEACLQLLIARGEHAQAHLHKTKVRESG